MDLEPYKATKLWNEIVRNFCSGMPLKRHRRHMRQHENCFTASEAIDWLLAHLQNNPNFNSGVTRTQTLQLLRKFLRNGLLENIHGSKITNPDEFKDNGDLYRFNQKSPMKLNRTPHRRVPLKSNNTNNENATSSNPTADHERVNYDISYEKKLPKCHLIARQLSVYEMEDVWKTVTLKRLQDILGLPNLDVLLDLAAVQAKNIIHNSTKTAKNGVVSILDKADDLPCWILSAMKCLANWPYASGSGSCLPNYPGFQFDVFAVVRDYFQNLGFPVSTFAMYSVLINVFVRAEYLDMGPNSSPISSNNTDFGSFAPIQISSFKSMDSFLLSKQMEGTRSSNRRTTSTPLYPLNAINATDKLSQTHLNDRTLTDYDLSTALSTEDIMSIKLPPLLCFETAFTAAEPVTRIVPQRHSTLNLLPPLPFDRNSHNRQTWPNKETKQSPFYLHPQENVDGRTVRRLRGKCGGYYNLGYLGPVSDDGLDESEKVKVVHQMPSTQGSTCSSYHTASNGNADKTKKQNEETKVWRVNSRLSTRSSSSSTSYYTPDTEMFLDNHQSRKKEVDMLRRCRSSPSKRQAVAEWVEKACWPDLFSQEGRQCAIDSLQLVTLLLPPSTRRKLHLLLRFMNSVSRNQRLRLSPNANNRSVVLDAFSRCILNAESESDYDENLALRLVTFLVDHYERIFTVPHYLENQVMERIAFLSRHKVTIAQYATQKEDHSRRALEELLDNILEDASLKPDQKKRRIKQFKRSHPHIYAEKCKSIFNSVEMDFEQNAKCKNSKRSVKSSFFRLPKSLRM